MFEIEAVWSPTCGDKRPYIFCKFGGIGQNQLGFQDSIAEQTFEILSDHNHKIGLQERNFWHGCQSCFVQRNIFGGKN